LPNSCFACDGSGCSNEFLRLSFAIFRTSFESNSDNAAVKNGNVAIAVPGDPERVRAIISGGRRIARYFGLDWIAVRIVGARSSVDQRDRARELLDLVTALGGRLLFAEARDIAAGVIELSCREHARVLVIGRSRRPRMLRRLRRGTTERILQAKRPFDVVVTAEGVDR